MEKGNPLNLQTGYSSVKEGLPSFWHEWCCMKLVSWVCYVLPATGFTSHTSSSNNSSNSSGSSSGGGGGGGGSSSSSSSSSSSRAWSWVQFLPPAFSLVVLPGIVSRKTWCNRAKLVISETHLATLMPSHVPNTPIDYQGTGRTSKSPRQVEEIFHGMKLPSSEASIFRSLCIQSQSWSCKWSRHVSTFWLAVIKTGIVDILHHWMSELKIDEQKTQKNIKHLQ